MKVFIARVFGVLAVLAGLLLSHIASRSARDWYPLVSRAFSNPTTEAWSAVLGASAVFVPLVLICAACILTGLRRLHLGSPSPDGKTGKSMAQELDPTASAGRPIRPRAVSVIVWFNIIVVLARTYMLFWRGGLEKLLANELDESVSWTTAAVGVLGTEVLEIVVCLYLLRGAEWARLTLVALLAGGTVIRYSEASLDGFLLTLFVFVTMTYYLFRPESNAFFRRKAELKDTNPGRDGAMS